MKEGEQEREALRIEAQRLKDELSDLRIEAEITQNKLRHAEESSKRRPAPLSAGLVMPQSPISEQTAPTTSSSPTFSTPPAKSASSEESGVATPPSPTMSEASIGAPPKPAPTPRIAKPRLSTNDPNITPRPSTHNINPARHGRRPSIPVSSGLTTPSATRRAASSRVDGQRGPGMTKSGSLYQIRGLIGKMQKLEERVHSARSKLPAPVNTPPRGSPRSFSVNAAGHTFVPSTVTVRSSKRRTGGSNASSVRDVGDNTPTSLLPRSNRLSIGAAVTPSRESNDSRPSSRASLSSRSSLSHAGVTTQYARPERPSSRQSLSGARTPLGHYSHNPHVEGRRPRSSLSSYGGHGHSASVSQIDEKEPDQATPTPRRSTFNRHDQTGAVPNPAGLKRRQSGQTMSGNVSIRRPSSAMAQREDGEMRPPERKKKLSGVVDVGETF